MYKPNVNLTTGGIIGAVIVICIFLYITHQALLWPPSAPMPTSSPIVTDTPIPSQQARSLISQFFTDINNGNYQSAYNLWSPPPLPYDQFVSGYANTRHEDITFGNITPLSDGTVSVAITISATEDFSGGTNVSTYQGTYIVGMQNSTWKILSGNFHKTG